MQRSKEASLEDLLRTLFSDEGLRVFLSRLPQGTPICERLPVARVSMLELTHHAVMELERHGAIDRDLFEALVTSFSSRHTDIQLVAEAWSVTLPSAETYHAAKRHEHALSAGRLVLAAALGAILTGGGLAAVFFMFWPEPSAPTHAGTQPIPKLITAPAPAIPVPRDANVSSDGLSSVASASGTSLPASGTRTERQTEPPAGKPLPSSPPGMKKCNDNVTRHVEAYFESKGETKLGKADVVVGSNGHIVVQETEATMRSAPRSSVLPERIRFKESLNLPCITTIAVMP